MSTKPVRILVVDDEEDVEQLFRQHFRKELRSGDLELQFAFSAQEALDIMQSSHPPGVVYIFSDINMPGMSGIELLRVVKAKYPDINVSMISAYGSEPYLSQARNDGADKFFSKPIDFTAIKEKVREVMGGM